MSDLRRVVGRLLSRGLDVYHAFTIHNVDFWQIPMVQFIWDKRARLNPHAEVNVLIFVQVLVGFIILNVKMEVNNGRSWIRGMFPGHFTGYPRISAFPIACRTLLPLDP